MRYYVLITHAKLAEGLKSSVELILGKQEKLTAYCAYIDPEQDVPNYVTELIRAKRSDDEYIVVTDLLGGSVNTAMMELLECEGVHIITGANLVLLMQLMLLDDDCNLGTEIPLIVEQARDGIAYVNLLTSDDEEDF